MTDSLKKTVKLAAVGLVVLFLAAAVITDPGGTGHMAKDFLGDIKDAGVGLWHVLVGFING